MQAALNKAVGFTITGVGCTGLTLHVTGLFFCVSVHLCRSVSACVGLLRCVAPNGAGWRGGGQLEDVAVTLVRYIFQSHGEISHPQECQHRGLDYHLPQCITLYITIQ